MTKDHAPRQFRSHAHAVEEWGLLPGELGLSHVERIARAVEDIGNIGGLEAKGATSAAAYGHIYGDQESVLWSDADDEEWYQKKVRLDPTGETNVKTEDPPDNEVDDSTIKVNSWTPINGHNGDTRATHSMVTVPMGYALRLADDVRPK